MSPRGVEFEVEPDADDTPVIQVCTSTARLVKVALVIQFTDALGSETKVWRQRPNKEHKRGENIYVGDVKNGHREWRGFGRNPVRDETYQVQIEIVVWRRGTDSTAVEERLYELFELIEGTLAGNPKVGGQPIEWAHIENFDESSVGAADGWECSLLCDVGVKARI